MTQDLANYKVQKVSAAALKTFKCNTENGHIEKLAKIGAKGTSSQNSERDLQNFVKPAVTVRPYWVRLPIRNRVTRKHKRLKTSLVTVWTETPWFLPWDIFDLIQRAGQYKNIVHPCEATCEDFWNDFMAQDYSTGHSIFTTQRTTPLKNTSPVHVHIDGVKVYKGSGFGSENIVWSMSGALSRGLRSKLILGQLPLWSMNRDTNYFVVSFFKWLFSVLKTGVRPRFGFYKELLTPLDQDCEPIVKDHIHLFAGLKTDLKEKRAQHRYPRNYSQQSLNLRFCICPKARGQNNKNKYFELNASCGS